MKVLLTGATGFIGRSLYPALVAAGAEVVCGSRDPRRAAQDGSRNWVELDVERPETIESAIEGCDAAIYLVHAMSGGADYPEKEALGASNFLRAATAAGVRRIVYLGGVLPAGQRVSKHLRSRQQTGEILRSGAVSTIELRAAMIIGAQSASWSMVRDLAARLPAMLLPRWLRNHSHPIAVDDVVSGLLTALTLPGTASRVFELPGAERIAHRDLLRRVAAMLGHSRVMFDVPVLTPRLSSYWIALVTRVDLTLARELVEGVRYDLEPKGEILWDHCDQVPMSLDAAVRLALKDEKEPVVPSPNAVERAQVMGRSFSRRLHALAG